MRSSVVVPASVVLLSLTLGCTDASGPVSPPDDPAGSIVPSTLTLSAPIFSLASRPNGGLVVGETLVGVRLVDGAMSTVVASLPGVSGVAVGTPRELFAVTGAPLAPPFEPQAWRLFRVTRHQVQFLADLNEFELRVNPDQVWNTEPPESNPFNLAYAGNGSVLVADAAGNDILVVGGKDNVDWVAVLPPQLASTEHARELFGCFPSPQPPPQCQLPPVIPAQPVATSIAVGPDGAYYAGELTGFPAEPGISRIWRITPGSLHVVCPGVGCELLMGGFTSIVDLEFGPDGTLYVVEFDAATWLTVELAEADGVLPPVEGGRVKACDLGTLTCVTLAEGLDLPTAVAVDAQGTLWLAENETIPGTGHVRPLNN